MEKQPPQLTPLIATKAANALNERGFVHYLIKAYCLHTLKREFFELHAIGAKIDAREMERVFWEGLGFPKALSEWAKNGVMKTAAGEVPTSNECINEDDLVDVALLQMLTNAQIDWAEIWGSMFQE